VARGPGFEPRL